jgi:hypothetical protein
MTSAVIGIIATAVTFFFYLTYPGTDLGVLLAFAAALGLVLLVARRAFDWLARRKPASRDPRFATPMELLDGDQHDLVGLRLAMERTVALPVLDALREANEGPMAGRAARVAKVLLSHQSAWRFVGLDATRPLPSGKARGIFESWSSDVRARFARQGGAQDTAFRADPLVVVALHVASPGRIPEIDVRDPLAAETVLRSIRDVSDAWAVRLDLWTSPRDFTAAELREADPTLREVHGA